MYECQYFFQREFNESIILFLVVSLEPSKCSVQGNVKKQSERMNQSNLN